jgi:hypothetical protein
MRKAICFDECGLEVVIWCCEKESSEDLLNRYPDLKFRYFEDHDPDRYYRNYTDLHYDPESDSYA